ncbi:MAG: hypothetical protein M5R36_26825 [Deltaproteobacteria bacterium]|nr:hypothetical protein [Deltaproteobacteria bacterium]
MRGKPTVLRDHVRCHASVTAARLDETGSSPAPVDFRCVSPEWAPANDSPVRGSIVICASDGRGRIGVIDPRVEAGGKEKHESGKDEYPFIAKHGYPLDSK